jgi:hypothetical protein
VFELLGKLCVELWVFVDAVVELDVDEVVFKLCDVSVVIVAVPCTIAIVSCTNPISCVIVIFVCCEITLFGLVGLMGEIGLTGLLIFVVVILQELYISNHEVQVGEPYGSEHMELLCS